MLNTAGVSRPHAAGSRFSGPLTAARVDGLGERWIATDPAGGVALELLRFRGEVATAPGFEEALRARVAAVAGFKDLAFAEVREVVQDGEHLTLVTAHVDGQRVSEVSGRLSKAKRSIFVVRLLRDATRALRELEAVAPGVTHGALTADRIVITPEGRVCITEHVLGSALQELALWPEELWTEFGLLARGDDEGEAVFDSRTTVMQLAALALSILLSRQITLQDFEHGLPALLDEYSNLASSKGTLLSVPLRHWLEGALQLGAVRYGSVAEAEADLRKLLSPLGPAPMAEIDTFHLAARVQASAPMPEPVETAIPAPPAVPHVHAREKSPSPAGVVPMPATEPVPAQDITVPDTQRPWRGPDLDAPSHEDVQPWNAVRPASKREQYLLWAAIALAVVTVGQAIAITRLMMRPPTVVLTDSSITIESPQAGSTVLVDGKPVGSTPVKVRVNPKTQAISLVAAAPAAPVIDPATAAARAQSDRTAAALDQAAARQRTGGLQVRTPIDLTVLQGDRVLGSTADGPIVASAGNHQLDFVNTALGFRVRQNVTIRAGVIAPLTITPPMGRISINAQPWAQVLIDDNPVGETPLANVQVPIGEHQITFRHPQMGERRERVTVRADQPARVSTTFQR